jgi:hypothetical protein
MHKMIITALVIAGSVTAAVMIAQKPAEARCLGCWVGAGSAAGLIGGAFGSRAYGYGYAPYAYAQPYYRYSRGYGYSDGYGYSRGMGTPTVTDTLTMRCAATTATSLWMKERSI